MNDSPLSVACRALVPELRALAPDTEQARRLPPALVERLQRQGLFRALLPKAWGGGEARALDWAGALYELARGDAAVGWCVGNNALTSLSGVFADPDVAAPIFSQEGLVTCGVMAPLGVAVEVEGGYRVSGRWPFASGSEYSTWRLVGAVVHRDGQPARLPNGAPETREFLVPAHETNLIDTWHTSGLKGTGSHDLAVEGAFVPRGLAVSLFGTRPRHTGGVYGLPIPGLFGLSLGSLALGIARASLDDLVELANQKKPRSGTQLLSHSELAQVKLSQREAGVRAGRSFLQHALADIEETLQRGEPLSEGVRANLRLASMNAVRASVEAVDAAYSLAGGSAVYSSNPIQRQFRDIHALTQHLFASPSVDVMLGRHLFGLSVGLGAL
jgi:indole-3-acetate monooxygenase